MFIPPKPGIFQHPDRPANRETIIDVDHSWSRQPMPKLAAGSDITLRGQLPDHRRKSDGCHLRDRDLGRRHLIAFEREGDDPPVLLVGGAFNDRSTIAGLAAVLAPQVTAVTYDRRGRGDSGDSGSYTVEREIEDLAAVISHAGGTASVFGHSSGANLALEVAAGGGAIDKLAVYEPMYVVEGTRSCPEARRIEQLEVGVATPNPLHDAVTARRHVSFEKSRAQALVEAFGLELARSEPDVEETTALGTAVQGSDEIGDVGGAEILEQAGGELLVRGLPGHGGCPTLLSERDQRGPPVGWMRLARDIAGGLERADQPRHVPRRASESLAQHPLRDRPQVVQAPDAFGSGAGKPLIPESLIHGLGQQHAQFEHPGKRSPDGHSRERRYG